MFHESVNREVTDLNIGYFLLAQRLLAQDRVSGMMVLGVTAEEADFLEGLAASQIRRLASANALVCGFRGGQEMPAVLETQHDEWTQKAHLFIVLSAQRNGTGRQPAQEVLE